jgi:hypothetical protein
MNRRINILKSILVIVSIPLLLNGLSIANYTNFKFPHSVNSPISLFDEIFSDELNVGDGLPDVDDKNPEESEEKDPKNSEDYCCAQISKSFNVTADLKLGYSNFYNKFLLQNHPDSITQPPRLVYLFLPSLLLYHLSIK